MILSPGALRHTENQRLLVTSTRRRIRAAPKLMSRPVTVPGPNGHVARAKMLNRPALPIKIFEAPNPITLPVPLVLPRARRMTSSAPQCTGSCHARSRL